MLENLHDDIFEDILLRGELIAVPVRSQVGQFDGLHAHKFGTSSAKLKTCLENPFVTGLMASSLNPSICCQLLPKYKTNGVALNDFLNGPTPASFCLFSFFSNTNCTEKL